MGEAFTKSMKSCALATDADTFLDAMLNFEVVKNVLVITLVAIVILN